MSASREKDSADFDLEAFIDLFDEAITSDDPSVQKTLQHLMLIAALARNHNRHDQRNGPLRRLYEDVRHLNQRISALESSLRVGGGLWGPGSPGTAVGPIWTAPTTTTGTQWPPAPGTFPPGTILAQSVSPPNSGAKSTTSYAYDPLVSKGITKKINSGTIAERVEDLLKDEKYKGSTLKATDVKTS